MIKSATLVCNQVAKHDSSLLLFIYNVVLMISKLKVVFVYVSSKMGLGVGGGGSGRAREKVADIKKLMRIWATLSFT